MLGWLRYRWTSLHLLVLSFGSFLLFMYGFCPLKHVTGRLASWDDLPTSIGNVSIDGRELYNSSMARVVFMIIDSWRFDQMSERWTPFIAELVKNRTACNYLALAEPPTVTVPRIKAMLTGTGSTFADVVYNLNADEVKGDSVVRAAHRHGRRNVFFGVNSIDELFPGLWNESECWRAINLADFDTVDSNITLQLDTTLKADEHHNPPFEFLSLHYIGLDHIEHLEGLRSPKVAHKLKEMDDVVRKIFTAMKSWDGESVLIVCGDHGMTDAGGHGGGTPAETQVPLVLTQTGSFQCPHDASSSPTVMQTAVAPSIAYLLRVPIPADSTGRALPAVLPQEPRQHLYLLHYNARQNARALTSALGELIAHEKDCYKLFRRAERQFALFLSTGQESAARLARQYYEQSLDEMAKYLNPSVGFDLFAIGLSIFMLCVILAGVCAVTLHSLQRDEQMDCITRDSRYRSIAATFVLIFMMFSAVLTITCAVTGTNSNVCHLSANWTPIAAAAVVAITYAYLIIKTGVAKPIDTGIFDELNSIDYLLIVGSVIHSLTFIGTSFIDEEHQTWYYLWNTLMLCVLVRMRGAQVNDVERRLGGDEVQDSWKQLKAASSVSYRLLLDWLMLITLNRLLRTLNHHWKPEPDTANWLMQPKHLGYLQALVTIGMALTFLICMWNLRHTNNLFQVNTVLTIASIASVVCYRIATNSLPSLHPSMASLNKAHVVNVFWGLLAAQFVFEVLFVRVYRRLSFFNVRNKMFKMHQKDDACTKREKSEAEVKEIEESPPSSHEKDLKLARSLSHVILNSGIMTATLLLRPHNVILVPSLYATCVLTTKCVRHTLLTATNNTRRRRHLALNVVTQTLVHYWIGAVFFFYQGNSNALTSVDFAPGFVGMRETNMVFMALLIAFHTYAAPVLAAMMLFCSFTHSFSWSWTQYKRAVWVSMNVLTLVRVYSLTVYTCVAISHKDHSYIFSSFSPKLLYDMFATVFTIVEMLTIAAIFGAVYMMRCFSRFLSNCNL